jgi:hypothetical protein
MSTHDLAGLAEIWRTVFSKSSQINGLPRTFAINGIPNDLSLNIKGNFVIIN